MVLVDTIKVEKLNNGLTVIAEPMAEVSSAAMVFLVPLGVAQDPQGRCGTAGVLSELAFRGAAERSNRELNDALDNLGLQRSQSVSPLFSRIGAAMVADQLPAALELYADILQQPHLPADQFEFCRQLALQGIESLEDDPRQKIALLAREQFYPEPLGRPAVGKLEQVQALTPQEAVNHWKHHVTPSDTMLAVAGKVDFEPLLEQLIALFGDWDNAPVDQPRGTDAPHEGTAHHGNDGAQVHIGVLYPSVHVSHPDYYAAMAAVSVLSGGMGSRLFTEVREKRGLCYAVGASHETVGSYGAVRCYLGSSPQQAQEGLDVMLDELVRLGEGISEDELERAKIGLRASLIMQGEASGARALRCAGDYFHLGRVRTLEEIETAIADLTVEQVLEHVRSQPPGRFSVTTLGPAELSVNVAI